MPGAAQTSYAGSISERAWNVELAAKRLNGTKVAPGELFGPSGAGYVRISCGGDAGRMREGLNRLSEFLAEQRGEKPTLGETPVAA